MTHLLPVAHLSEPVLGALKAANLHTTVVLLIFQHSPASQAAQVRCHEDVPRHIYGLFQALGIQYRWVLTRGPLGRELLKAEDLVIDDAKEGSWMVVYEQERDLLEDTVYRRLVSLWSEFSDAYAVFDQHGPAQLLCAQQVWEALLAAFGDISRAFDYMGALTIDNIFRSVILATLKSSTNRALRTAYD